MTNESTFLERETGHCLERKCCQSELCECDCKDCRQKRRLPETILADAYRALSPSNSTDFGDEGRLFAELAESLVAMTRLVGPLQRQRDDLQSRMSDMVRERQAQSVQLEKLSRVVTAADRVGVYRRTLEDMKEIFKPLDELQETLDWMRR